MPLTKTKPGFPNWCQAPMEGKQVWTKPWRHSGPDVNSSWVWFRICPTWHLACSRGRKEDKGLRSPEIGRQHRLCLEVNCGCNLAVLTQQTVCGSGHVVVVSPFGGLVRKGSAWTGHWLSKQFAVCNHWWKKYSEPLVK